jgi:hypothetical protein
LKKRLCIFSFYDQDGYVAAYVPYLLENLSKCVDRLLVIVNGRIDQSGQRILERFTTEILIRENTGYDAGAYKYALVKALPENALDQYEEVVLCNDTFFGPLKNFETIFSHMDQRDCDFWGLNGYFDVMFSHIQSYFLVFRKRITGQGLLTNYFLEYIDETTTSIKEIYGRFEFGLFDFLTRQNGMTYDCYAERSHINIYSSSYMCLKAYGLPILKKKTFSNLRENWDNIWCTLSYIKYETNYDVEMILDYVRNHYGLHIRWENIERIEAYTIPEAVTYPRAVNGEAEIEAFVSDSAFYIYGAGVNGSKCYWRFARENPNFKGFIVSDGMGEMERELYGHPVLEFSEAGVMQSEKILLAVEKQYADEIVKTIKNKFDLMRIF